jgi:steroid 5-alpha reductase family enzyme
MDYLEIFRPWLSDDLMLVSLPYLIVIALGTWLISLYLQSVNIIDYCWPLMLGTAVLIYAERTGLSNPVNQVLLGMTVVWASLMSWFMVKRGRNRPEDKRYREYRQQHGRYFPIKSLYLIFLPQAFLVWALSTLFAVALSASSNSAGTNGVHWSLVHSIAVALFFCGLTFKSVADNQLHRFNQQVVQDHRVLNTGLWKYSRHPNYFGEFCVWWAWLVFAIPAGEPVILLIPVLVIWILTKMSFVKLMERDISNRRSGYLSYMATTSRFIPWLPKESVGAEF